jgi:hypothetical protein
MLGHAHTRTIPSYCSIGHEPRFVPTVVETHLYVHGMSMIRSETEHMERLPSSGSCMRHKRPVSVHACAQLGFITVEARRQICADARRRLARKDMLAAAASPTEDRRHEDWR